MPIVRCKDQQIQTLQQFFTDTSGIETKKIGEAMLSLIDKLNGVFKATTLYGLTSLYRLVLLSENTHQSPWYVMFASDGSNYYVDYLRPDNKNTELDLTKSSKATDVEEALQFVLTAMRNSGGWAGNKELG